LNRNEGLAVVGISIITVLIIIGILFAFVKVSELTSVLLTIAGGGIVGLFVWGFKSRFEKAMTVIEAKPKIAVDYDENDFDQYSPVLGYRKILRIRVKNDGNEVAKDCEAWLKVTKKNSDPDPTTEEKFLQWTKHDVTKLDIPRQDSAFLCVVFSIKAGFFGQFAFVATPKSSDFQKPPRSIDGFKVGTYEFKIRIKPANIDEALFVTFKLDVKINWKEISMSKMDG